MTTANIRTIVVCSLAIVGCMEIPGAGGSGDAEGDGGRPLLLRLPSPPTVGLQGSCQAADAELAWDEPGGSSADAPRDGGMWIDSEGQTLAGGSLEHVLRPRLPGDLVITEFMADPATLSDADGEWFEIHNPGSMALEIGGCEIAEGAGAGATIAGPLWIAAGGFLSISRRSAPGFVPAAVVSFSLKNSSDTLLVRCGGAEIDRVAYGPDFPMKAGVSAQLDPGALLDGGALANDSAASWCLAEAVYAGDRGTPGMPNTPCGQPQPDLDAGAG